MNLLLSGLDTVECAYYLRPTASACLDFDALRLKRETHFQSKSRDPLLVELGGMAFELSRGGRPTHAGKEVPHA